MLWKARICCLLALRYTLKLTRVEGAEKCVITVLESGWKFVFRGVVTRFFTKALKVSI